jgi:uncharacterized membrane protein
MISSTPHRPIARRSIDLSIFSAILLLVFLLLALMFMYLGKFWEAVLTIYLSNIMGVVSAMYRIIMRIEMLERRLLGNNLTPPAERGFGSGVRHHGTDENEDDNPPFPVSREESSD